MATFIIAAALSGCQPPSPAALPPAPSLDDVDLLTRETGTPDYEQWYVHSIGSHKLGHRWYREFRLSSPKPRALRTAVDELAIPRFGSVTHQTLRTATLADQQSGQVEQLEYVVEPSSGGAERRTVGKTMQSQLFLQSTKGESQQSLQQPWTIENGAFFAVEQSLYRKPMEPGEQRVVTAWPALVDQPQSIHLKATGWEFLPQDSGNRVLRIEGWATQNLTPNLSVDSTSQPARTPAPQRSPHTIYWATDTGRLQKTYRSYLNQTTIASTKQAALAPNESLKFDIALQLAIPVLGLDSAETSDSGSLGETASEFQLTASLARFKVEVPGGDVGSLFPPCEYQQVVQQSKRSVEIVVGMPALADHERQLAELSPHRTGSESNRFKSLPPGAEYVAANRWIDSRHPDIKALADRIEHRDSIESICQEATARVHKLLKQDFLNGSLLTASQALQAKAGDCTEHAMLLAAVLRVHQIPTQVATGLILDPESARFQFHMWTEAWTGSGWLPLDATSDRLVPSAQRLRIGGNSLSESSDKSTGSTANSSDWAIVAPVLTLPRKIKITFLK